MSTSPLVCAFKSISSFSVYLFRFISSLWCNDRYRFNRMPASFISCLIHLYVFCSVQFDGLRNDRAEEKTPKRFISIEIWELFILELRKYAQKNNKKKIIIMNTIHPSLARAERNAFYLECNGKSHRTKK